MEIKKFSVSGMTCAACSAHVDKAVRELDGVTEVSVNLLTNSMTVEYEQPTSVKKICEAVSNAGYSATEATSDVSDSLEDTQSPRLMKRLIMSLVLLIPLMYVTMGHIMWNWYLPNFVSSRPLVIGVFELVMTLAVMLVNKNFFVSGFKSAMRKAPNMDALVSLGSGAAFVYSTAVLIKMAADSGKMHYLHDMYFESAAMILTLITVGKLLEARSKSRTTDAVKSLISLAPKTATLLVDGKEKIIPADEVRVGDIFAVKPGESIPVDAVVVSGESAVDESALTGESIPVDKTEGNTVSSATINRSGYLVCRATHVGEDTTLRRIISMVENAASSKAPISKAADKVSGIFVPTVIVIAVVTGVIWLLLGRSVGYSLARAISVLVISCPCALGLATPVAIMVGSGVGAKHGILFKNAEVLEIAGKINIAIFDKTGTITSGKPAVTDVICSDSVSEAELLSVAGSLEMQSEHPLAKAIMSKLESMGITAQPVSEFKALLGSGVSGNINGKTALCGNSELMRKSGVSVDYLSETANALSMDGKTPLYFALDGKPLGIIAVADSVREDSKKAIAELKSMGVTTVMLTGDNRITANAVAKRVGIDTVVSDVLPSGKDTAVKILSEYGRTAMIGDGINDAPALIRADVGVAIGEGSDTAVESASIVIMRPTLDAVVCAVKLSRKVLKNIYENLFWAFIYNCIGIPLAAGLFIAPFGWELNPMFGAAAMSLSSFFVVSNSLRLNFFKASAKAGAIKPVSLPSNISEIILSQMEEKTMTKTIYIEGMMCNHCTAHVKKALEQLDGVKGADVSLENKCAVVTLEKDVSDKILSDAITENDYTVTKIEG